MILDIKGLEKLAKELGESIKGGEVIFLEGDLGAGKTTFSCLLLRNLGVKMGVKSPTFNYFNRYFLENLGLNIYHFDLYRVSPQDEDLGEIINEIREKDQKCIFLVEWPQNLPIKLGANVTISLDHCDDQNLRKVIFKSDK